MIQDFWVLSASKGLELDMMFIGEKERHAADEKSVDSESEHKNSLNKLKSQTC